MGKEGQLFFFSFFKSLMILFWFCLNNINKKLESGIAQINLTQIQYSNIKYQHSLWVRVSGVHNTYNIKQYKSHVVRKYHVKSVSVVGMTTPVVVITTTVVGMSTPVS